MAVLLFYVLKSLEQLKHQSIPQILTMYVNIFHLFFVFVGGSAPSSENATEKKDSFFSSVGVYFFYCIVQFVYHINVTIFIKIM